MVYYLSGGADREPIETIACKTSEKYEKITRDGRAGKVKDITREKLDGTTEQTTIFTDARCKQWELDKYDYFVPCIGEGSSQAQFEQRKYEKQLKIVKPENYVDFSSFPFRLMRPRENPRPE
jgi:hypothetical protein